MTNPAVKVPEPQEFHLRKLARSGISRYLSVGTLLPIEWEAVKVYIDKQDSSTCVLRLELIT